jgi:hypothetical protein
MSTIQKMMTAVQQRPAWGIAGAVGLAVLTGAGLRLAIPQTASLEDPSAPNAATDPAAMVEDRSQGTVSPFESPMVSVSWHLQSATPQALLASTRRPARLDSVIAGRSDPFAPITQAPPVTPGTIAAAATTAPSGVRPGPAQSPTLAPLPTAGTLPSLPTNPVPVPLAATPNPATVAQGAFAPLPLPGTTLVSTPTSPLQGLELTGVAQVGDRVALIVREANTTTSRYTYAGDYLANGQVLVKRIDLSAQEPLVILEYNGREYSRMVGGTTLAALP